MATSRNRVAPGLSVIVEPIGAVALFPVAVFALRTVSFVPGVHADVHVAILARVYKLLYLPASY